MWIIFLCNQGCESTVRNPHPRQNNILVSQSKNTLGPFAPFALWPFLWIQIQKRKEEAVKFAIDAAQPSHQNAGILDDVGKPLLASIPCRFNRLLQPCGRSNRNLPTDL